MPDNKSNKPINGANMRIEKESNFIKLMKKKARLIGGMETSFIIMLVIGIIVALSIDYVIINYLVVMLCGLGLGILLYVKQYEMRARYVLMGLSFIIGYIVGVRISIRFRLFFVFLISIVFGYIIYKLFLKTKKPEPEE